VGTLKTTPHNEEGKRCLGGNRGRIYTGKGLPEGELVEKINEPGGGSRAPCAPQRGAPGRDVLFKPEGKKKNQKLPLGGGKSAGKKKAKSGNRFITVKTISHRAQLLGRKKTSFHLTTLLRWCCGAKEGKGK